MKTAVKEKPSTLEESKVNAAEATRNPFLEEDNPFDPNDLESLEASQSPSETKPEEIAEQSSEKKPIHWLLYTQIGIAVFVVMGCIYTLTRPCVIGQCQELETAKSLSQKSKQTVQTLSSAQAPELAHKHLKAAINLLETIPFWSPHHYDANTLLTSYRKEATELNNVNKALMLANEAAQLSQNPPHAAQHWQKLEGLWQEAIATLDVIPKTSLVYPFAQERWQQYRANLAEVRARLKQERDAELTLANAKKIAQVAEARQGVAKQADSWQQVFDNWQQATNSLATIPNGTLAYQSAQVLLARYQPKLEASRDRKTIEQVGEQAFNLAVSNANQAKLLEERSAWSEAVQHWSRAVNYAKQVPMSSSYYLQAKPLLESYNESWKRADAQNKIESRMSKARQDLSKICNAGSKVCNYSVSQDMITVRLTSEYVDQIKQTATLANKSGDVKKRAESEKHVNTLKVALEAISENAKIPLEVYKPNGEKIATHLPL